MTYERKWSLAEQMSEKREIVQLKAKVAELEDRVLELKAALDQTYHYLILNDQGWALEHLVVCRKTGMDLCAIHHACMKEAQGWWMKAWPRPGVNHIRYAVDLDREGHLVEVDIPHPTV